MFSTPIYPPSGRSRPNSWRSFCLAPRSACIPNHRDDSLSTATSVVVSLYQYVYRDTYLNHIIQDLSRTWTAILEPWKEHSVVLALIWANKNCLVSRRLQKRSSPPTRLFFPSIHSRTLFFCCLYVGRAIKVHVRALGMKSGALHM